MLHNNQWWGTFSHEEGWEGFVIDAVNDEDGHLGLLIEIRTRTRTFRRCVDVPDVHVVGSNITSARIEYDKCGLKIEEVHYVSALVHSFVSFSAGVLLDAERFARGGTIENALLARVESAYLTSPRNVRIDVRFSSN